MGKTQYILRNIAYIIVVIISTNFQGLSLSLQRSRNSLNMPHNYTSTLPTPSLSHAHHLGECGPSEHLAARAIPAQPAY